MKYLEKTQLFTNKNRKAFFTLFVIGDKHSKLSLDFWALFSKKYLKSALGNAMRIVRGHATQELRHNIAKDRAGRQAAIHVHGQRNRRIDMSAAKRSDQEDDQCQHGANDQRVATTGKDSKNKEKGSEVLCEVRFHSNEHGSITSSFNLPGCHKK